MYLAKEIINNFYDEIRRRTRLSKACDFFGGNLLKSEDSRLQNCMDIHYLPMKAQMNIKAKISSQFCCKMCNRKLLINAVHAMIQSMQFVSLKHIGIASRNISNVNIAKNVR